MKKNKSKINNYVDADVNTLTIINSKKNYKWIKSENINVVPNKLLVIIRNVFSVEECNKLINISENKGYNKASLYVDKVGKEHFYNDLRDSLRVIIDDKIFAKILEDRISHIIPNIYNKKKYAEINERMRFLKYDQSGHFKRHIDGKFEKNNMTSKITILIYINEGYNGGYTKFFSNEKDNEGIELVPETGMVCLMDQNIEHEVPELINGVKYVIRTELMYYSEDV
jgi:hypothetical protein